MALPCSSEKFNFLSLGFAGDYRVMHSQNLVHGLTDIDTGIQFIFPHEYPSEVDVSSPPRYPRKHYGIFSV